VSPHAPSDLLAIAAELLTALLTVSGIAYCILALWSVRRFERTPAPAPDPTFAPGITILKPVKGVDPRMHAGLASHCAQNYAGPFEILFGVSSLSDPAVAEPSKLAIEGSFGRAACGNRPVSSARRASPAAGQQV